ncbi:unnamed protein product [Bathycoccus prasinos]
MDMRDMFRQAFSFDHVIGNWITSQVTDFNNMFYEADAFQNKFTCSDGNSGPPTSSFNHDIGEWITSQVTGSYSMFYEATAFQNKFTCSDVNHGPPSSCTLEPNEYLVDKSFNRAISLCLSESPMDGVCTRYGMEIKSFGIMSDWDVSRVTNMKNAFRDRSCFNANITKWDTSQVTSMREMFLRSYLFNSDIGSWKTEAVTDMRDMFRQAFSFDHVIGNWITSQVTDFNNMFYEATAFQNKLTCSDVNHGPPMTSMREMFLRSYLFNSDIGSWKTEAVTDMREMFRQASSFNHDIGEWITSQVTGSYSMFYEATAFQNKFTCSDVNHGPPSSCTLEPNEYLVDKSFNRAISLCLSESPMDGVYTLCWKTEAVTDMREMFLPSSFFNHDIGEWITSQVTGSYSMFYEATAFQNKFTCSDVNHGPPSSCAISENF